MNYTNNLKKAVYTTPKVAICSVAVEAGFQASMPGVTIKPWEPETDDSLEF
jgi:hypothetical protein